MTALLPLRASERPGFLTRLGRRILGIRLQLKVLGANFLILVIAIIALWSSFGIAQMRWVDMTIIASALALGGWVNFVLVRLALRPVRDLEEVARRVSQGKLGERVRPSLVADPGLSHLGKTMNEMLDTLADSRDKIRRLGADVMFAHERERAQVARDLHDSVGQTLVAASFQIAAAVNDLGPAAESVRLTDASELLRTALEDIRNVSRSLHPRVTDDLGLPMALEALADSTRQRSLIDVRVRTDISAVSIPALLATTLYRVAQEALSNVEKHSDAGAAMVCLRARPRLVELEIRDDGCGFAGPLQQSRQDASLKVMRERLSLVGGELHIDSTPESGTRVLASVRLDTEAA